MILRMSFSMWHLTACPWSFERLWSGWPDGNRIRKTEKMGREDKQTERK